MDTDKEAWRLLPQGTLGKAAGDSGDSGHTCAGAIGHQHVAIEAEALVATERVHAAVLAGPRLQAALVQVWKEAEQKVTHL